MQLQKPTISISNTTSINNFLKTKIIIYTQVLEPHMDIRTLKKMKKKNRKEGSGCLPRR